MFRSEFESVFVLRARPVMVAAMEEVKVVAFANCLRLRMNNFFSLVFEIRQMRGKVPQRSLSNRHTQNLQAYNSLRTPYPQTETAVPRRPLS